MSPLQARLLHALLNRKKRRNALEQGFTLVELLIVIVIVGILSAIALPNFLSQTARAKATECKSQLSAQLKQVAAEYVNSGNPWDALAIVVNTTALTGPIVKTGATAGTTFVDALSLSSNAGRFNYTAVEPTNALNQGILMFCQAWDVGTGAVNVPGTKYPDAEPDNGLSAGGIFGCVNLATGQTKLSNTLLPVGTSALNDTANGVVTATGEICGLPASTTATTGIPTTTIANIGTGY